jgi:hypothetical protein
MLKNYSVIKTKNLLNENPCLMNKEEWRLIKHLNGGKVLPTELISIGGRLLLQVLPPC